MAEIRRKLYKRGSSYETTIPFPLLFALDLENRKYAVVFRYEPGTRRWFIDFEEQPEKTAQRKKK